MNCETCGRQTPQRFYNWSAIDPNTQYRQCGVCASNNCESVTVITRVVNAVGWKEIHPTIRKAVRVYDMEQYITVPEWAKRLSHRQIAPCTPEELTTDEKNAEAAYLVEKMKQVAVEPLPTPNKPGRFWRTLQFVLWCVGFEPARSAI